MNILLGILMVAIGSFLSFSGLTKSNFIVYKILVARSRILWGKKVHAFYSVIGILIIIMGLLLSIGLF